MKLKKLIPIIGIGKKITIGFEGRSIDLDTSDVIEFGLDKELEDINVLSILFDSSSDKILLHAHRSEEDELLSVKNILNRVEDYNYDNITIISVENDKKRVLYEDILLYYIYNADMDKKEKLLIDKSIVTKLKYKDGALKLFVIHPSYD